MSNKKHKKKRQPTWNAERKKAQKKEEHTKAKMSLEKKFSLYITITLIIAILCAGVGAFITLDPLDWFRPAYADSAAQYLQEKYNMEFEFAYDIRGGSVYTTQSCPTAQVAVYNVSTLTAENGQWKLNPQLFDGRFADNGYCQVYEESIVNYYKQFITEPLGNHKIFAMFDEIPSPSEMTDANLYETYVQKHSKYLQPRLYIVTDISLSTAQLQAIENSLKQAAGQVRLSIAKVPQENQEHLDAATVASLWMKYEYLYDAKINYTSTWDYDAVEAYLNEKYGTECNIIYETEESLTIQFKETQFSLYKTKDIGEMNPERPWFTQEYADDAYCFVNNEDIIKRYDNVIQKVLPDTTVYVFPQLTACPSDVKLQDSIDLTLTKYPDLFNPIIFIIMKDSVEESKYNNLIEELRVLNDTVTICAIQMTEEQQASISSDYLFEMWKSGDNVVYDASIVRQEVEIPDSNETSDNSTDNDTSESNPVE